MTFPKRKTAGRWALAILSGSGVAIVFYSAVYAGFEAFMASENGVKALGNIPVAVLKIISLAIACIVGGEVLRWVLRLPERKN